MNSYAKVLRVGQIVVLALARDRSGYPIAAWICAAWRGVEADSPTLLYLSVALPEEGKEGGRQINLL